MQEISCQAILFDLDGVLVDSTMIVKRHWSTWAAQHNVDSEFILAYSHGRRTIDTLTTLSSYLDIEPEREVALFEKRACEDTEGLVSIPGAVELLSTLNHPGLLWAVVTSCSHIIATARLQALGLPIPPVFVTAEQVEQGKPHPEGYLKAAELLGLNTQACLVIEDSPAGIEAACAAGCPVVGVTTTFPAIDLGKANFVVSSLKDLSLVAYEKNSAIASELRLLLSTCA